MVSWTCFARDNTRGVRSTKELYFLWHVVVRLVQPIHEDEEESEVTLSPACWFMDYLASVVEGSSEIAIGGMVILLVLGVGADLSELNTYKVAGLTRMTLKSMHSMRWIRVRCGRRGSYEWLVGQPNLASPAPYTYLPRDGLPHIVGLDTWILASDFAWSPPTT